MFFNKKDKLSHDKIFCQHIYEIKIIYGIKFPFIPAHFPKAVLWI